VQRPGTSELAHGPARGARCLALLLAVTAASCSKPAGTPEAAPAPGEWVAFEGTWSAVGERHTLQLGPGRRASVATLSGTLLLTGVRGLGVGFQARAITFSDSQTGGLGRAVWIDERGDEIFSELSGGPLASGRRIAGTITGGTGRWVGVMGAYELGWQFVIETEEGVVQGRAVDLKGRARLGGAPAASPRGPSP
jgi:hypothetical protein